MARLNLAGARQVSLCTMESLLPKSLEFLILYQFGGESSQELCAFAHSTHRMRVLLRLELAGDANVWHPHFTVGRSRSADDMIVPFIELLISSCRLVLCNPRDKATHYAGAALDLICSSSNSPMTVRVHDGDNCCSRAPACCPLSGQIISSVLEQPVSLVLSEVSNAPKSSPLLRDWRPTLLRAFNQLSLWAEGSRSNLDFGWIVHRDVVHSDRSCTLSTTSQTSAPPARMVGRGLFGSMCCTEWCHSGPSQGAV